MLLGRFLVTIETSIYTHIYVLYLKNNKIKIVNFE